VHLSSMEQGSYVRLSNRIQVSNHARQTRRAVSYCPYAALLSYCPPVRSSEQPALTPPHQSKKWAITGFPKTDFGQAADEKGVCRRRRRTRRSCTAACRHRFSPGPTASSCSFRSNRAQMSHFVCQIRTRFHILRAE
jgi:hypothetical protein